jgi:hypothetical protein
LIFITRQQGGGECDRQRGLKQTPDVAQAAWHVPLLGP